MSLTASGAPFPSCSMSGTDGTRYSLTAWAVAQLRAPRHAAAASPPLQRPLHPAQGAPERRDDGPERQPARAQPVRLPVLASPKLALGCLVSRGTVRLRWAVVAQLTQA